VGGRRVGTNDYGWHVRVLPDRVQSHQAQKVTSRPETP
jgi:hypothetical protein